MLKRPLFMDGYLWQQSKDLFLCNSPQAGHCGSVAFWELTLGYTYSWYICNSVYGGLFFGMHAHGLFLCPSFGCQEFIIVWRSLVVLWSVPYDCRQTFANQCFCYIAESVNFNLNTVKGQILVVVLIWLCSRSTIFREIKTTVIILQHFCLYLSVATSRSYIIRERTKPVYQIFTLTFYFHISIFCHICVSITDN